MDNTDGSRGRNEAITAQASGADDVKHLQEEAGVKKHRTMEISLTLWFSNTRLCYEVPSNFRSAGVTQDTVSVQLSKILSK